MRSLRRALGRMRVVEDPRLLDLATECAGQIGLRRVPVLLTGPAVETPAVVGTPVIYRRNRLIFPRTVIRAY